MTEEEIKAAVMNALPLRPPKWDPESPPNSRAKIEQLENYLLESAYAQAELEEALFYIDGVLKHLKDKVDDMTGYEAALPPKRRERVTQADVDRAKRLTEPHLFELGAEFKRLRETSLRQVDRLRFEAQWVISRAYSLISGG